MNIMTNLLSFLLRVCIAAVWGIFLLGESGCANIVPPGGGPKDTLPPLLIRATPADSALNVKTQRITLEFNEFVDIKNPAEAVLISPLPEKFPLIEAKLRTITVRLRDTLQPNTTYIFDFGNSIADINEGNKISGLRYAFSTGNQIDTNSLQGRVIIAETGKTDSTLLVLLHSNTADSAVVKQKPSYITRVDGKGYFNFSFLPAGKFAIYALKDADGDKRYNQPTELFAFADSLLEFPRRNMPIMLYAYAAEKERRPTVAATPAATDNVAGTKRLRYSHNLENGQLHWMDTLRLRFNTPLLKIDTAQIRLIGDSQTVVNNVAIVYDTLRQSLLIQTDWQEGGMYRLLLGESYAEDTAGAKPLKADTLSFTLKKRSDYGTVRIRFQNLDTSRHPVLLFYVNDEMKERHPLKGNEWYSEVFKPGIYDLAILLDDNQNGQWDPGIFWGTNKKQPERVIPLKVSLTVKANWDNELKIDLAKTASTENGN